jgi:TRAP-type mannitol/chloroaromatic compound transport system permease small subunit
MPAPFRLYVRAMDRISEWVGIMAMYLIFVMIGVLLLDAITRNLITYPLHWCVELAQFTLAAYYFMGGAKTLKDNTHVRMDLFYDHMSDRNKARMDIFTVGCLMFYLVVMLVGSLSSLGYAIATNETRFSMWNPSMIPIKSLMVGCIALMLMQSLSLLIKHVAAARGKPAA